ncbi:hypothetical protein PA598K_02469 [Paenibacillus sp. 598K]|uniref:alpha-amylase n=1 Tax=Paenibacillus sp. 598K TaxID=1117987 RepID=UPI000FF94696|nr:alpha-amylase [Paenibacillus sp. 598K]GBF74138.1 hypothetical protein PA598K_02469 [Paenibacillus sp. 598K]
MPMDSPLQRIADYLIEVQEGQEGRSFWVPELWNSCEYREIEDRSGGEIRVNAVQFIAAHLQALLETGGPDAVSDRQAVDLDESVIYSSLVRYSTAWDYDHDGRIQSGTFLRMLLLLPILKRMGVNILYMLPVTRYSTLHLKGNIGSPYAVQSLFDLDPRLHDPLLDGMPELTIHDELSALVEACHLHGIRVVVDFIPRVTARNSDLIREHPEWVYWIRKEELDGFRPPHIPELGFFEECTPDKLETVYRSAETAAFLDKFSHPPNVLDPELWERLRARAEATGEELLTLVEEEMGITTSPAHSDWINDVQPIWTDITFLRLYSDFSPVVRPYIRDDQAPYVLFDTIKCNYYPAEQPNRELWEHLLEGVRYNLDRYGIDGFRIDIGHVLPTPLLQEVFDTIRLIRPQALLISEDLFNRNHSKAAAVGYNIMLGSGWNVMTDMTKDNLLAYVEELPRLDIHVFACAETADTPRIVSRGGIGVARMISVFNHFLPQAIPFLATGFELNEAQPMNCGLGDNTDGADIPRAFFHEMTLNWTNPAPMIGLLERLSDVRRALLPLMRPANFFTAESPDGVVIYGYRDGKACMAACFNLSELRSSPIELSAVAACSACDLSVVVDSDPASALAGQRLERVQLQPHQALVMCTRLDPSFS